MIDNGASMSASLLSSELTNLISESKRKQTELRSAADKSLQELKSLPATSDQSLYADLSQRPVFVEPFVLACSTHNPKLANIGVTCLQRLIVGRGLPVHDCKMLSARSTAAPIWVWTSSSRFCRPFPRYYKTTPMSSRAIF